MSHSQHHEDELSALGSRLRTALAELEDIESPNARDHRPALRRVLARAWRAAAACDSKKLWDIIELIREARPLVDDVLPALSPRQTAAVELQQALGLLYLGEDELREIELEARLSDHGRNPVERAVLRVLVGAEGALRQGEVHELIPSATRPTVSRVGQILRELFDHGYVRRSLRRARGGRGVSHYLLAPRGWALCREHKIKPVVEEAASTDAKVAQERPVVEDKATETAEAVAIHRLVSFATETTDPRKRAIALNMVVNSGAGPALPDGVRRAHAQAGI